MVKLSWDAIRRALGIPEPAPGDARRGPKEAGGGGREGGQAAAWTGKPLDVELSAEVSVTPPPAGGRQVSITYSGRLAHEAAGEIYLHYGAGPGDWQQVQETAMVQVGPQRFRASVPVPEQGTLEFCFRDDRGQWDNNDGRNWSIPAHPDGPAGGNEASG